MKDQQPKSNHVNTYRMWDILSEQATTEDGLNSKVNSQSGAKYYSNIDVNAIDIENEFLNDMKFKEDMSMVTKLKIHRQLSASPVFIKRLIKYFYNLKKSNPEKYKSFSLAIAAPQVTQSIDGVQNEETGCLSDTGLSRLEPSGKYSRVVSVAMGAPAGRADVSPFAYIEEDKDFLFSSDNDVEMYDHELDEISGCIVENYQAVLSDVSYKEESLREVQELVMKLIIKTFGNIKSKKSITASKEEDTCTPKDTGDDSYDFKFKILGSDVDDYEAKGVIQPTDELCDAIEKIMIHLQNLDSEENAISENARARATLAKDKVKAVATKTDKAAKFFHDKVNRIKDEYDRKRKEESTEAVLKDSIPVLRTLRNAIRIAPVAIISPGVALMLAITLHFVNKSTDKKQRAQFIGDLKLQIKLLDDKISQAENNGDNKAKEQLVTSKHELEVALEKLQTNRTWHR
jgi:hypothetical protein